MVPPLISLALALIAGILAGDAARVSPLASLAVAGAFAAAGVLLFSLRVSPKWTVAAALAAVAATAAADTARRRPEYSAPEFLALLTEQGRIVRLRGFVDSDPAERTSPPRRAGEEPREFTRFILGVTELDAGAGWRKARGRLQMTVEGAIQERTAQKNADGEGGNAQPASRENAARKAADNPVGYGDVVEMAASVRAVPVPGNPGVFDYRTYLARKGIVGIGRLAAEGGIDRIGEARGFPGLRHVFNLKRRILKAVEARLPGPTVGIVKCLALGDRYALTEEQMRAFRETGLVHFLAISGLHVGLLAAFCWGVLAACGVGHRASAGVVLAVVLVYALLTGCRPSVQRAAIMCGVICGGFVFARRPNLTHSLALALIVILLHEPAELYVAGLQLSFAAVAGIWLFSAPLERSLFGLRDELDLLQAPEERSWFRHPVRWIVQKTLAVCLAAWLTTLPLTIQYFHTFNLITPLASMLMLPFVGIVVVFGLSGAMLAPVLGGYVQPLLTTAHSGAWVMDRLAGVLAGVPGVLLRLPPPGLMWVAFSYVVFAMIALRARLRLSPGRVAILLWLPALAYLGLVWHGARPEGLRVSAVSVGMGNCVLVQFPSGRTLLFDAGSTGFSGVGSRVIAPALWSLGVRRLDVVVLSHGDADHYNGLAELAERIPVGRIAVSPYFGRDRLAAEAFEAIDRNGTKRLEVARGDRVAGFADAELDVLWPPPDFSLAKKLTDNELSVVLRVRTSRGSVLLTGDFGERAVQMLMSFQGDLRADVLQVPHHGLPDSGADALAAAVAPKAAVIPGGRYAEDPSPYAAQAGRVLATDDCGMITIDLLEPGWLRVETFLPSGRSEF